MPARILATAFALLALLAASASPALAYEDPPGCTQEPVYDPTIPTFQQVNGVDLGAGGTGSTPRRPSAEIYAYFDAVMDAVANNPRVKVIRKDFGASVLGKPLRFYVVSSKDNIDNLDAGRKDGPFWEGVKDGSVSEADAIASASERPALGWLTATPHGAEPAAAEALARMLYELTARTDCFNQRRLAEMDLFLMPVRNPDGRDAPPGGVRTSAWAFDHNRDFGTQNQAENFYFLPLLKQYPGVFFVDAHQQSTGYFFPPNEDPVHHEVSNFALDFIQNKIGPALQQKFNDQSSSYRNYNTYDLFVPEYGDSVPTLLSGAAGMTFEKGTSEVYGKQVYDHYLAMDETVNVTVRNKNVILRDWAVQWEEAVQQGAACTLQPNKLVSPTRGPAFAQIDPSIRICGYFYRPDAHTGDMAELVKHMQRQGVHVYRFDTPANLAGVKEFGGTESAEKTLPAGTLYIPMEQPLKHWIQAVLGENPYQPLDLFYDVAQWSYSLQRGLSTDGVLTTKPVGVQMTEIAAPDFGGVSGGDQPVQAFDTDSMRGLALAIELLDAGATVHRAKNAFNAGGKQFRTGAALVATNTIPGAFDLGARSEARQTPVTGLANYPVARYAMAKPKIGVYTGAATEPNNPLRPTPGSPYPGHCGVGGNTVYCQALYTLTAKIGLPGSMVLPINNADLTDNDLVNEGFTALLNPSSTITATTGTPGAASGVALARLQEFVNAGGTYVGALAGGTTSARSAGVTSLNTVATSGAQGQPQFTQGLGFSTPGSFFSATFDTTNPVAWGFDDGGWIYRQATSDPVYDPATLTGNGGTIGPAAQPVRYSDPLVSYGFSRNATGTNQLPGRPAVVDQPFGQGHAVMIGFDPYYRAWREQDERIVLNSVLYPRGAVIAGPARRAAREEPLPGQTVATEVAEPVAKSELTTVANRPLKGIDRTGSDVRITVARKQGAKLRRAVKAARLSKALRKRSRFVTTKRTVTFVVRGVRVDGSSRGTAAVHDRGEWEGRIVSRLKRARVKIVYGQL